MNTELMTHVERAVRPVRTHHARKMQMRDELYALLADIHEDEQKRDNDENAAVTTAIRRFGPAESLTAELQATLSWWDRWIYLEERLIRHRLGESVLRHAARAAINVWLIHAAWMLPVYLFFMLKDGSHDGARVLFAMLLGAGCGLFLATPLAHASFWCFTRDRWSAASVAALALLLVAFCGLVLLIGFGIHWFAALDFESALRGLVWWMPCALFATVAFPALTLMLVRKTQREER